VLHFADKGQERFEEFIKNRLLPTSTLSLWNSMKKIMTFSNWMEETKVRLGKKVIKLRDERELLGRFLIIPESRPELDLKLEDTVPRSICAIDGSLYIPLDKPSLMHADLEFKNQSL